MKNEMLKISNTLCHSTKKLPKNLDDALLSMQVMMFALYNAVPSRSGKEAKFDLSDIPKLGLGIQYTETQLEDLINHDQFKETIVVKIWEEKVNLVQCAICRGTDITIFFNPVLNEIIRPTEGYSLFSLPDLVSHHSAGAIALHLLLTAEQNENHVLSGDVHTYTFDFLGLCDILGLKYSTETRPGCSLLKCLFKKATTDFKVINQDFELSFKSNKTGSSHRLTSIELTVSGFHSEGIYGLSPVETLDDGDPWFSTCLGQVMGELIANNSTIHFAQDSLGRCTAATSLLTQDQVIPSTGKGGTKLLPLGYDSVIASKGLDDRYAVQKAHLIAQCH